MLLKHLLGLVILMLVCVRSDQLKVNQNGTFKIVQFTDIHLGEGSDTDKAAQDLMRMVLDTEKPDFVVSTGDIISGYAWDGKTQGWYAENYKTFTQPMIERNLHWAITAGNHDTEADLNRS